MIIMCHFRQLTLFIMFTVNSQWEEIQQKLFLDQTAVNQSDLMTQIFHLKLTDLLQQLKHVWIFDHYLNCIWIIKYQKCRLLHLHLLLFLHLKDHFLNIFYIDQIVFTELFDSKQNSTEKLTDIIQSVMTHRLCNADHFTAFCMSNSVS